MRFEKLTIKAQEAVVRAQELAQQQNHSEILPLHLLVSLLQEEGGVVTPLLQKLGANVTRVNQLAATELERLPKATGTQLGTGRATQEVFTRAQKEADRLKDEYVSTEHFLLALAEVKRARAPRLPCRPPAASRRFVLPRDAPYGQNRNPAPS